MSFVQVTFRI